MNVKRKRPLFFFPRFMHDLKKIDPVIFSILDDHDSIYDHVVEYCTEPNYCPFFEGCGWDGRFCKGFLEHARNNLPMVPWEEIQDFVPENEKRRFS